MNCEDLAYLAGQIADDIDYEYENPAIQQFVRSALSDMEGIFREMTPAKAREELKGLAESAVTYIRHTVVSHFHKQSDPQSTRYLRFFIKACRDDAVTEVNLFTRNHDTLIEDFLRAELENDRFKVADGLCDASNGDGSRRWNPQAFDKKIVNRNPYGNMAVR